MKVDVLGLGDSLKEYKYEGNLSIGVNDIYKYHSVDALVLVDKPGRFEKERLKTIKESKPAIFYSHLKEWSNLVDNFKLIDLIGPRGSLKGIESDKYCYSNNSTFVAVVLAYKLGATEINVFGADFKTHPNFKDRLLEVALDDFKQLFLYLKSKGIVLNVSEGSKLKELI
jgi:hypothetical protein